MKRHFTKLLAIFLITLTFTAVAAPKKKLWKQWTFHRPASTQTINYNQWQDFLDHYVFTNPEGINLVAYSKVTKADKQKLKETITSLATLPISQYNRNEQLAYWINLYNALTISVILDHYPVQSIRDINLSSGLFKKGPWDAKLVTIEKTPVSLNDIEHRILRPIWDDSRIHYALNCASYSCPNLLKDTYTSKNAYQLMNENAVAYVNSPRGAHLNDHDGLVVSSLYMWYRSDFGGNDPNVIQHLRKYAQEPLITILNGRRSIKGHEYNWALNDGVKDS